MKKIVLILLTVSLNVFLFSCTPEDIDDKLVLEGTELSDSGDDDGQTPEEP